MLTRIKDALFCFVVVTLGIMGCKLSSCSRHFGRTWEISPPLISCNVRECKQFQAPCNSPYFVVPPFTVIDGVCVCQGEASPGAGWGWYQIQFISFLDSVWLAEGGSARAERAASRPVSTRPLFLLRIRRRHRRAKGRQSGSLLPVGRPTGLGTGFGGGGDPRNLGVLGWSDDRLKAHYFRWVLRDRVLATSKPPNR